MSLLSQFSSEWMQAQPKQASEFWNPEDGQYDVEIEDVKYTEDAPEGQSAQARIVYTLRVLAGEYEGERFRKFDTIRGRTSLEYVKGDLMTLGITVPADIEFLPQAIQSARGSKVVVKVKTSYKDGREYKNTYINKFLQRGNGGSGFMPGAPSPAPAQPKTWPQAATPAQPQRRQADDPYTNWPPMNNEEIPF